MLFRATAILDGDLVDGLWVTKPQDRPYGTLTAQAFKNVNTFSRSW